MYRYFFKRLLDIGVSLTALIILAPFLLVFALIGALKMKGDPFFYQERPGKDGKIFKLIKFRTMSEEKDTNGDYLPDDQRLNAYGKWLRATSIDELPELFNILKGDMSLVGPRPLLVRYLPLYNERQRHRHDVRPGLTGLAQVNGRNLLSWEDRFEYDLQYVKDITFLNDVRIIFKTIGNVLRHEGISSADSVTMEEFKGTGNE